MKIQHQKTKEHSLWLLHHWKTITFCRYPKQIRVKFAVAVFIMNHGNSIFSWFNIWKLKLASLPLIWVNMVLDANFRNLLGKPFLIQIAQAMTPVLFLIFWIFTFTEGHSIWAKPFEGIHTKLIANQKVVVKIFLKTEYFRLLCISKKSLKKYLIYHIVVTTIESCCFGFNKNICNLCRWFFYFIYW
jgi:hypothetical protein